MPLLFFRRRLPVRSKKLGEYFSQKELPTSSQQIVTPPKRVEKWLLKMEFQIRISCLQHGREGILQF
jgi:hypothetical protein